MAFRDMLLQANTHPERTPDWALAAFARLTATLEASASLAVCTVRIPSVSNWLANKLLDMDGVIARENAKSRTNQQAILERFEALVPASQRGETHLIEWSGMAPPPALPVQARAHDLTVVPFYGHAETASIAESLVFESGRPVLLLPDVPEPVLTFDRLAIAWDGSRVAARALADALPLCRRAQSVAVVQVVGEKDLTGAAPVAAALRHLSRHGIDAAPVAIELEGANAAAALQAFCGRDGRDLLVMGAFGHSRAREFVLGGATNSIVAGPQLPILMSH